MSVFSSRKFITYLLIFFIPYAFLIISGAIYTYNGEKKREYDRLEQNESQKIFMAVTQLNHELDELFRDLIFLSKSINLREAIAEPSTENLTQLADDFINFSASQKFYDQIRWLDEKGLELLRINYHKEQPRRTTQQALQNKGKRYYFKDTFVLDKGEVFVSPLDLNIEHGSVEIPYKPMIRIGTPVFDAAGNKRGIILLNYNGSGLLKNVKNLSTEQFSHIQLINKEGYWLLSPNSEDEWGFMLGKNTNIALRHPKSWKNVQVENSGQFYNKKGLWSYGTVYPLIISEIINDTSRNYLNHQSYFWKVVSHIPLKQVEQLVEHTFIKLGISAIMLLILGAISSWYIALVTLRHEKAEIMAQRLSERSLLLQSIPEGVYGLDVEGSCQYINTQACQSLGYSEHELIGKNIHEMIHHHHQDGSFFPKKDCPLFGTNSQGIKYSGEQWFYRKDGSDFPVSLHGTPIFEGKTIKGSVVTFRDITEQKKTEEVIWQQANYDPLTLLPNRNYLQRILEDHIKQAQRHTHQVWVFFLDLDAFKEVNDVLGIKKGDELLILVAKRIQSTLRQSDVVARLGGDEFVIILSEMSEPGDIDKIASSLLDKVSKNYTLENDEISITASIGIANYPNDAGNAMDLLKYSDQSMSVAKSEGKNRYTYFTPELQYASKIRIQIIADLRKAIANNEFQLYYQPIVNLDNGQIHKAEALIRWMHPEKGIISPAGFIPIAEETDIICDIGSWIFDHAFKQLQTWQPLLSSDFQLSINMSPLQLKNRDEKYNQWLDNLNHPPLSGANIVLEITEGLLIKDEPIVNKRLLEYRDSGIQVAIDDFGTGYSSLSYLKEFDIDYLKIDQSFVRNLKPGSREESLSEAIIVMAHKLDLKVIAEGIETEQQLKQLKSMGCDYGQGYYFSKPSPANEFEKMFLKTF